MAWGARRRETKGGPPAVGPGAAVHTPIGGTKVPPAAAPPGRLGAGRRSFLWRSRASPPATPSGSGLGWVCTGSAGHSGAAERPDLGSPVGCRPDKPDGGALTPLSSRAMHRQSLSRRPERGPGMGHVRQGRSSVRCHRCARDRKLG